MIALEIGGFTQSEKEDFDPDRTSLTLKFVKKQAIKTSDKKQAIKTSDENRQK